MIKVYTIHCPKCNVLVKKLEQANISFQIIDDITILEKLNIDIYPKMQINDGDLLDFKAACEYIKTLGDNK